MTDEELLAEEYICNGKCQDDITRNYVHCMTCTRLNDFLAGLKAGRPKWHKVADGDLPPLRMVVFVFGYLGDMKDLYGFDEWDGEKWLNEDMPGFVRVAWCEIPRFEVTDENKKDCSKCRHYKDTNIYTYDILGHCHVIGTKKPSDHCKKCMDAEYNMWEKKDND